jgi:ketosteroid isomerase-like protein
VYDALAKGDVPAVLASFDPNIEWNEAEHFPYWTGQPFRGPEAIVNEVFARIPKDFDGFRVDVRRIVGLGDTVLSEARYRGTAKATGKPLDAQVAHVWDLRNGKVVKFQQYADTWLVAQVTGTTPKS